MTESSKKVLKIVLLIAGILLVVVGGIALFVSTVVEQKVQKELPGMVAKATDSLYVLEDAEIDINVLHQNISIKNLRLKPDTFQFKRLKGEQKMPGVLFDIFIPQVDILNISWGDFAVNKEMTCEDIIVQNPQINIRKLGSPPPEPKEGERRPPKIKALNAARIKVTNPQIVYKEGGKSGSEMELKGGEILLTDWVYNIDKPRDPERIFYASGVDLKLQSFIIKNSKGAYKMSSGAIQLNNKTNTFSAKDFKVLPAISPEAFYKKIGHQKEIYQLRVPLFKLEGIDWKKLLNEQMLFAEKGSIENADINISLDRNPPPNPEDKTGRFPQQILKKLPLPIFVKQINVSGGKFAYTERNYKTNRTGVVKMENIRGEIENITNLPEKIKQNKVCKVSLKGNFKGSEISSVFNFRLDGDNGAFSVDGSQGAMDGTKLNDITKPLALAELESLDVQKITFHIDGNESGAHANMTMLYSNLKVNLLEVEDDNALDKKDVTSFFANKLFTYDANPHNGKEVRRVTPSVKREVNKSFFNLIWRCIFTGALQTVGRRLDLDEIVNKKRKKQEAERLKK